MSKVGWLAGRCLGILVRPAAMGAQVSTEIPAALANKGSQYIAHAVPVSLRLDVYPLRSRCYVYLSSCRDLLKRQ